MCKIEMEITRREDENMEEEDDNMVEAESMEEDELTMVEINMMFMPREDPNPYPIVAISPDQQLLLDNSPFVGDTRFPPFFTNHFMPLPVDAAEISTSPASEIPPLPSSDDQQENLIVDVQHCEVNEAVEIVVGTPGDVDLGEVRDISEVVGLGKDSELEFSEAQLELNTKNLLNLRGIEREKMVEEENLEVGFDSSGDSSGH